MPVNEPSVVIRQFLGLRNKARPDTLAPGALTLADNIDIDNGGAIERRRGYTLAERLSGITAAYATRDEQRLFVVADGTLYRVLSLAPVRTLAIASGLGDGAVAWDDAEGYVFTTGAAHGVIVDDVLCAYSEFGAPAAMETESLQDEEIIARADAAGTVAAPEGEHIAFFGGRVWIGRYDAATNQSFIFRSRPFRWGAWDLFTDYIPAAGRLTMLAGTVAGVLIGTDRSVLHYSADGTLQTLAEYGVVPGAPFDRARDGTLWFWTVRGLCRAVPFQAVTEDRVSVDPGARCAVCLTRARGVEHALIATSGRLTPDNPY